MVDVPVMKGGRPTWGEEGAGVTPDTGGRGSEPVGGGHDRGRFDGAGYGGDRDRQTERS